MKDFFESSLCNGRKKCRECRRSSDFRKGVVKSFDNQTDENFECPFGVSVDDFPDNIEPSLADMVKTLVGAVVVEVKSDKKSVSKGIDQAEIDRRLELCRGCQFWTGNRCEKCGCFMKLKARMKSASCPIGKW